MQVVPGMVWTPQFLKLLDAPGKTEAACCQVVCFARLTAMTLSTKIPFV